MNSLYHTFSAIASISCKFSEFFKSVSRGTQKSKAIRRPVRSNADGLEGCVSCKIASKGEQMNVPREIVSEGEQMNVPRETVSGEGADERFT